MFRIDTYMLYPYLTLYCFTLAVFTTHYTFGTRLVPNLVPNDVIRYQIWYQIFYPTFSSNNFLKQLSLQNNALRTHEKWEIESEYSLISINFFISKGFIWSG